ncbi:uncharacterized protein [Haliotis cracherodii]|uniref:uncharacterized protein n=1 Tax=Haliotis cracherodii TaxID=6455 RepID=UPI0039EC89D1
MEKSSSANPLFSVYLIVLALSLSRVSGGITVSPSSPVKVDESAGTVTVTVTNDMLPMAGFWGFTSLTSDETATAGSDYTSLARTLSQVPFSQPSVDLTVNITDDNDLDPGETFLLMLKDFFSGESDINVTICINDNELAPVELKQPGNFTVKEGQSNNNITLKLERADASTRTFTVQVNIHTGTAVPDLDITHLFSDHLIHFAENEMSKTIPLASLINDQVEEPSKVFTVVIKGQDLKDDVAVHVTIKDDDSVISIITTSPPDPFHCGRGKSQPCLNNGNCTDEGCHPSTGYCNCTSGFTGVNCGINPNTLSPCNQACVNGTCVNGACICDPGFAGELCDKNAYYHQCNPTNFSVCITPFSLDTFSGVVYVKNFQNVSECNLTLAPSPADPSDGIVDWCKGYAAAIPYNGTCGELGPTVDGNYTLYELSLLVQYTSGIKSCTDEKVTFTCRYDNNSLHIVNTYDANSFHDGSVVRETANYVPAILTSTAADGSSLTPPLALGTTAKICISVKEIPGLDGIVIHKITVHNNRPIPDKRSITLYDQGCIPDTAAGILTVSPFFTPTGEKHTICLEIRIFVFEHDIYLAHPVLAVKVYFKVVRHDALSGAVLPTCGSRKKRQTDDDESSLSTTYTITITDGGENAVRTSLDRSTDNKSVMVPIVVGLGSLAIAVAVVAIAVWFIITKRRRRSKLTEKDDLPYSTR